MRFADPGLSLFLLPDETGANASCRAVQSATYPLVPRNLRALVVDLHLPIFAEPRV